MPDDVTAAPGDDPYRGLTPMVAADARATADRIRTRMRACIIETGGELHRMKLALGHGHFRVWHETALGMEARTVQNYMAAHRAFADKGEIISHLNATTIVRLAAKSVPQSLRDTITTRLAARQSMTDAEVMRAIQDARVRSKSDDISNTDDSPATSIKATADIGKIPDDWSDLSRADDLKQVSEEDSIRPASEATTVADQDRGASNSASLDDDLLDEIFGPETSPVEPHRPLDMEKFAKVRALHDGTSNAGERDAAAGRMAAMAGAAGITVTQAIAQVDAVKPASPRNLFEDIFNAPEFVAARAERERERAIERAAILSKFGSEDAVFADTSLEAALRDACTPLLHPGQTWEDYRDLCGWSGPGDSPDVPSSLRDAVTGCWPLPETVHAAWEEFRETDRLILNRCVLEYAYTPHLFVEARQALLEHLLDVSPARSLRDLRARLAWMKHCNSSEGWTDQKRDGLRLETLTDDIERFAEKVRTIAERPEAAEQSEEGEVSACTTSLADGDLIPDDDFGIFGPEPFGNPPRGRYH